MCTHYKLFGGALFAYFLATIIVSVSAQAKSRYLIRNGNPRIMLFTRRMRIVRCCGRKSCHTVSGNSRNATVKEITTKNGDDPKKLSGPALAENGGLGVTPSAAAPGATDGGTGATPKADGDKPAKGETVKAAGGGDAAATEAAAAGGAETAPAAEDVTKLATDGAAPAAADAPTEAAAAGAPPTEVSPPVDA